MPDTSKFAKVYSVEHIGLAESEANLIICASGLTNSSGWGNSGLSPWAYVDTPADGIQDFDLVAEPPTGIVL